MRKEDQNPETRDHSHKAQIGDIFYDPKVNTNGDYFSSLFRSHFISPIGHWLYTNTLGQGRSFAIGWERTLRPNGYN